MRALLGLLVKIITNDRGPFEHFQKLKGFNNSAFVEAMGSTSNRVFVVWDRTP